MIQSIDIAKLRNAEYIEFSNSFLAIVALHNKNLLKVSAEHLALETAVKEVEALFKIDQGSNLTPVIEELDIRRDRALMGLYKYVDAHTTHFDAAKQQAATVLMGQLKVYGTASDVATATLPAETAILKSLVNDFTEKPAFKPAVEQLALGEWLIELQVANELLAQKYLERTQELGRANPLSLREKRLLAYPLYYALRDMLVAQATVAKNVPPYPQAISELNALIAQYHVILAGRATAKEGGAKTEAA